MKDEADEQQVRPAEEKGPALQPGAWAPNDQRRLANGQQPWALGSCQMGLGSRLPHAQPDTHGDGPLTGRRQNEGVREEGWHSPAPCERRGPGGQAGGQSTTRPFP